MNDSNWFDILPSVAQLEVIALQQRVIELEKAVRDIHRKLSVAHLGLTIHGPQYSRIMDAKKIADTVLDERGYDDRH